MTLGGYYEVRVKYAGKRISAPDLVYRRFISAIGGAVFKDFRGRLSDHAARKLLARGRAQVGI